MKARQEDQGMDERQNPLEQVVSSEAWAKAPPETESLHRFRDR